MKNKEEIKKIAEKLYPISPNPNQMIEHRIILEYERGAFINGYNKCQEDNADKKYTESQLRDAMEEAMALNNNSRGLKQITEYINSLNKQD
jgi:hypothetical protein